MNQEIKLIKNKFYILEGLYNLGIVIFSATIYLYLENIGYTLSEISLFISLFWLISFVTEIPSGMISDSFGRRNTMLLSCLIRAAGLLFLFISEGELIYLILGAVLTSIGETLKSGTLDSWLVESVNKINSDEQLDKIFSMNGIIGKTLGMAGGFIGAQFLGNINLSYPIITGAVLLCITAIFVASFLKNENTKVKEKLQFNKVYKEFFNSFSEGIRYFRKNKSFSYLVVSFLPLTIILAGPSNQWQLFFQGENKSIITGYLWIFIGLMSIIGTWFIGRLPQLEKKRMNILIINVIVNSISIAVLTMIESYIAAFALFLVHVFITAGDEIIRITALHKNIKNENRATIISFYYTLEAIFTIVGLVLVGVLSDYFNMNIAWFTCALLGFVIALPTMILAKKRGQAL
ncbi:MFS transporter [Lysinibacillus xylanilyticus]|uniref:MFS transporter n=1 Tax=Lysinibacillus xylanilyticus TaxID=582475 RepID=UPI003D08BA47